MITTSLINSFEIAEKQSRPSTRESEPYAPTVELHRRMDGKPHNKLPAFLDIMLNHVVDETKIIHKYVGATTNPTDTHFSPGEHFTQIPDWVLLPLNPFEKQQKE